jgi:hypothetical protein
MFVCVCVCVKDRFNTQTNTNNKKFMPDPYIRVRTHLLLYKLQQPNKQIEC